MAQCMNNQLWTTAVTPCGENLHAETADQGELNKHWVIVGNNIKDLTYEPLCEICAGMTKI